MIPALVIALLLPGLALIIFVVIQSLVRGKALRRCPGCGRELHAQDRVCPNCGAAPPNRT